MVTSAVDGAVDLPAPGYRPAAPQSVGPSRFGSESVRRDLGNMSVFRDQQPPASRSGAAAANGHAAAAGHGHELHADAVQVRRGIEPSFMLPT